MYNLNLPDKLMHDCDMTVARQSSEEYGVYKKKQKNSKTMIKEAGLVEKRVEVLNEKIYCFLLLWQFLHGHHSRVVVGGSHQRGREHQR